MIRPYVWLLLLAWLAIVAQTALNHYLFPDQIQPDFLFIMVVLLGLFRDPVHGAVMAFLLGGLQDYFSGQALMGVFLFSFTLIFLLANLLRRRFSALSAGAQFCFVLAFGGVEKILVYLLLLGFAPAGVASAARWPFWIAEIFLNAALAPVFYQLMVRIPGLLESGTSRK